MPTNTGSYNLTDLRQLDDVKITTFGEAELAEAINAELAAHNRRYRDMAGLMMDVTTERIIVYGNNFESGMMQELDEFTRTPTQRIEEGGGTFNLPLRKYGDALGWTRDYLQQASVADIANRVDSIEVKDVKTLYSATRQAIFNPTNYTMRDFTVDRAALNVVRLVNGDGMVIPNGPEGEVFNAATHTHYLAAVAWDNATIDAAINTVREHGHRGQIRVFINATNRGAIAALTKYEPLGAPLLQYSITDTRAIGTINNDLPDDNRTVGVWDGLYEVATKPWVPAGYAFVYDVAGPRPLAMRIPTDAGMQGLRLAANIPMYPLQADYYEHRFGVGIRERTNGAVVYFGGASYVAPAV